jgi:hypothetical protein
MLYSGHPITGRFMPDNPESITQSDRSQVETWMAELAALRLDPTVKKFLELQERIKWTYALAIPSLSDALGPYDLYDAFEFARDLAGREVSARALSRLLFGRFPEMSNADWQAVMHFLIERGAVEVVRTTEQGRPDSYRFATLTRRGNGGRQKILGLPSSELSALKREDLEDVAGLHTETV